MSSQGTAYIAGIAANIYDLSIVLVMWCMIFTLDGFRTAENAFGRVEAAVHAAITMWCLGNLMKDKEMELFKRQMRVVMLGSGIGEAIARKLSEFGASVVITDIDCDKMQNELHWIVDQGSQAKFVTLDVTDFQTFHRGEY